MNKKDKYLKDYFDKKKEDISFITVKQGASLKFKEKEYITDKELPLPVRVQKLIEDITKQKNDDAITISNIIDGIIYLMGSDKEFEYLNDYKYILNYLNFKLEPFIIMSINNYTEKQIDDSVIYGKALVNFAENERNCFIYASVLEEKANELIKNNNEATGQYFLEEAHNYYEKSLDYNDKFALSYYKLGYYYKLKQQYVKAKAFWEKHQELDDDNIRIDEIRNELIQLQPYVDFENGYNLILKEHPKEGLELLLPLVKEFSGWWNLLFFIGLAYRMLGDYNIAETYFENVLKLNNVQKDALNELGLCKIVRGKYVEAAELFTKLLNIEPGNCEVFCNRAVSYLYNDQLDRAEEDIQTALKINPHDEVALSIKNEINRIKRRDS